MGHEKKQKNEGKLQHYPEQLMKWSCQDLREEDYRRSIFVGKGGKVRAEFGACWI